jgi:cytochrome P450
VTVISVDREFNPFSPESMNNPYPAYADLLERYHEPIYLERLDMWLVHRYEHVKLGARLYAALSSAEGIAYHRSKLPVLFGIDPPDHTRMRGLIRREFTPRGVRAWTELVTQVYGEMLDEAIELGELDLVERTLAPLPVRIITTLLGIPGEHEAAVKLTEHVVESFIPNARLGEAEAIDPNDPAVVELRRQSLKAAFVGAKGLSVSLHRILEHRRQLPPDEDLVSKLLDTDRATDNEVLWLCLTLLVGGISTMGHFLGSLCQALLDNPDEFAKVRARPELVPKTIEETARYYPAVQTTFRTATEDVRIGDTVIPRDSRVELSFASGNRDPWKFEDPDAYRIERNSDGHLGFGAGIHTCVGAHLARLEAATFLRLLIERTESMELIGEPVTFKSPAFRGLTNLPVRMTPRSASAKGR